ncbi:hypothetical protein LJC09_00820 [Desulfovibrio sp. OttesenSCG-928-F20]|nr:hypothetical protein [Desulfovibrio sp. OttesenSCG-928-F20]
MPINYLNVTAEDINQIQFLLERKKWFNVDEELKDKLTEKFINTISILDNEERILFYAICDDFININSIRYDPLLRKIVKQMLEINLISYENIFIIPIIDENDRAQSILKSGESVAFFLKSIFIERDELEHIKLEFLSSPEGLAFHMQRQNSLVIFCDDFIGSGAQFNDAIKFYNKYSLQSDRCIVATIAILKSGYEEITRKGYEVFYEIICNKGISDNLNIPDKENAKQTMTNIESKINVKDLYKFGFRQSEALIAIRQRAPDNTFPIFWWPRSSRKHIIFPRE